MSAPLISTALVEVFRKVQMEGTIKAYSECVNAGVIIGANGKTYGFYKVEWTDAKLPQKNTTVTFDGKDRQAFRVHATR